MGLSSCGRGWGSMTETAVAILRVANLALMVATLGLSLYGTWRYWPRFRGAFVPPLLYSLGGIVLTAATLSGFLSLAEARLWWSVHALIGTACIFGITVILVLGGISDG